MPPQAGSPGNWALERQLVSRRLGRTPAEVGRGASGALCGKETLFFLSASPHCEEETLSYAQHVTSGHRMYGFSTPSKSLTQVKVLQFDSIPTLSTWGSTDPTGGELSPPRPSLPPHFSGSLQVQGSPGLLTMQL